MLERREHGQSGQKQSVRTPVNRLYFRVRLQLLEKAKEAEATQLCSCLARNLEIWKVSFAFLVRVHLTLSNPCEGGGRPDGPHAKLAEP